LVLGTPTEHHLPKTLGYGRQSVDDRDISAVAAVLETDYLTTSPRVEAFEAMLCEITGADQVYQHGLYVFMDRQ